MGLFLDLVKDLPLSAVMRERIIQFEADILKLKEEKAELKEQLADAKEKYQKLFREFEEYRDAHEKFVEVKGMKFKRLDSGAYSETPYCINPGCHNAPMSVHDDFNLAACSNCHYKVQATSEEVHQIVESLSSGK